MSMPDTPEVGTPSRLAFHLDEHVDPAIADGLRRRGIDVTTTREANLRGAGDDEQLASATARGRVLFTQDADFLRLARAGVPHAGIAYCRQNTRTIGQIIEWLALMSEVLTPADMADHVEYP
jgi:predicted nuclease of predicted toxin-antitoxin system